MRRLWLIFAQTVTVSVAVFFVVGTLKPEWLHSPEPSESAPVVTMQTAAPVAGAGPASPSS